MDFHKQKPKKVAFSKPKATFHCKVYKICILTDTSDVYIDLFQIRIGLLNLRNKIRNLQLKCYLIIETTKVLNKSASIGSTWVTGYIHVMLAVLLWCRLTQNLFEENSLSSTRIQKITGFLFQKQMVW